MEDLYLHHKIDYLNTHVKEYKIKIFYFKIIKFNACVWEIIIS